MKLPPQPSSGADDTAETNARVAPGSTSHRDIVMGACLVVLIFVLLSPAKLWRPGTVFTINDNVQIGEAQAWWHGRLDLPERRYDTALKDGKVFSYFPPAFTIIAAVIVPFFDGIPHWFVVVGLVLPCILLAYRFMLMLCGSVPWACVLTIGFISGTSFARVADAAIRGGMPYHVNHLLACMGIFLILIEMFGKNRIWPALVGLALAALSRQLTILYFFPVALMAFFLGKRKNRLPRLIGVTACTAMIGAGYCGLNYAKFGHPLRTGYMLNHEGRNDVFAREARQYGILSLHWVPRNLYYANIGFPQAHMITKHGQQQTYLRPNIMGTGIWWTTPLLLWLLFDWRRRWSDHRRMVLLVSGLAVYGLLMLWHATGEVQRGYNRYSLDYLAMFLAAIIPACLIGRRRWISLGMVAWSLIYFQGLLRLPHLRIW